MLLLLDGGIVGIVGGARRRVDDGQARAIALRPIKKPEREAVAEGQSDRAGTLSRNPARAVKALREGRTKGKRGNALDVKEFRRFITTVSAMMVKTKKREGADR